MKVMIIKLVALFMLAAQVGMGEMGILKNNVKDPLEAYCNSSIMEEGSEVYVLNIDINQDGTEDILISASYLEDPLDNTTSWRVFLKTKRGYKYLQKALGLNRKYVSISKDEKDGSVKIFSYAEVRGKGHTIIVDPKTISNITGYPIQRDSEEYKKLFSNNLAKRIKVVPQERILEMYGSLLVVPKGKMEDLDNNKIGFQRIKKAGGKATDSSTTDTLKMLGIQFDE